MILQVMDIAALSCQNNLLNIYGFEPVFRSPVKYPEHNREYEQGQNGSGDQSADNGTASGFDFPIRCL